MAGQGFLAEEHPLIMFFIPAYAWRMFEYDDNMFEFAYKDYLWFLWLMPLMLGMFMAVRYCGEQPSGSWRSRTAGASYARISGQRPVLKFILFLLSLAFIILALAGPRFGSRLEEVRREGVEIIIALDVSNSMLAEDILPNRLERSKMAVSRLASTMRNDRIGLIVFAGDAFVQVPVTVITPLSV
jgi:Ca-activated chloride channel homolog